MGHSSKQHCGIHTLQATQKFHALAPSSGHRLPRTGSEMPRVDRSFCSRVHLISLATVEDKNALLYSFTKCCQEQNTGLSYQKACVLKAFCCHFNFKAQRGWGWGGALFLPHQEGSFHFIAPSALPFVFLPHSLSTLPAPRATHYNGKSTRSLRSWESGFPL